VSTLADTAPTDPIDTRQSFGQTLDL
jgi:hypothetical protein